MLNYWPREFHYIPRIGSNHPIFGKVNKSEFSGLLARVSDVKYNFRSLKFSLAVRTFWLIALEVKRYNQK